MTRLPPSAGTLRLTVLPGWLERGVLAENKKHRPAYKLPVRVGSGTRPVKCFVFKAEHLENPEAWEE